MFSFTDLKSDKNNSTLIENFSSGPAPSPGPDSTDLHLVLHLMIHVIVKVFGIMKVAIIMDVQKHTILLTNIHGVTQKVCVKKEEKIIMNQNHGKSVN